MEQTPLIHSLVTDIDMSGSMKGLELPRHAAETRPDCSILVISGRYSPSQGALPPRRDFLSKPVSGNSGANPDTTRRRVASMYGIVPAYVMSTGLAYIRRKRIP